MKLIGIDTGTHTGVAIYETISKRIERLETLPIHKAMALVLATALENPNDTHVYFEDARLRKWFGRSGREQLQGAGSVKRDCAIWEEYLTDYKIPFTPIAPKNNATKLTADYFAKVTGWTARTSGHARDAAMLVFGRRY